jgi:hypothetical protein
MAQNSMIMAALSIPLFLALAVTSFYYAWIFWKQVSGVVQCGLYATPKFAFFAVLGVSAMLDIPTFIACVSKGGPSQCSWNTSTYSFVWSLHLIATCGYLYAVITPSILWSDIIQQKDGNFWNSKSPLDLTKILFRVSFVLYCCVIFTNIVGVSSYKHPDKTNYSNSSAVGAINNLLMPVLLVVVTFGCFVCGLRLRSYVMKVQLGSAVQDRVLLKLTFTMFMICASYSVRAVLVMSLYNDMPATYSDDFNWQYVLWLPITQWIPFVLCSFCLINEMCFQGNSKAPGNDGSKTPNSDTDSTKTRVVGTVTDVSASITNSGDYAASTGTGNRSYTFSIESVISEAAERSGGIFSTDGPDSRQSSVGHDSARLHIVMSELARGGLLRGVGSGGGGGGGGVGAAGGLGGSAKFFSSSNLAGGAGVEGGAAGGADGTTGADTYSRSVSTDNYFSTGLPDESPIGAELSTTPRDMDHFFTTNAMHGRSSV